MVQMREVVVPILESYGVDLVLCGHSHVYERSWPLKGHYGFSSTFDPIYKVDSGDGKVDGSGAYQRQPSSLATVYITAAVGGQPRDSLPGVQHPAHLLKKSGILGSLVIDVDGGRLDFRYVNTSGASEDYFTILKDSGTAPTLTIWRSGGGTAVSWPATAASFELQVSGAAAPSASWQRITNGISTQGDLKVFTFDPATNGPAGYFRLKEQ
jgi:hypothetical protein